MFEKLSGTALPEGAGDFRLLDRKAVDAMNRMRERVRFNKGLYAWMGFRSVGVPFTVPPRTVGSSRWRPRQLIRFAIDGITTFTTIPLRVWSYLGLLISLFAFGYAVAFLYEALVYGISVPGFPTLIISVLFFSGVQLISLGVIGEYLGRVYEEVKGRPLFLVAEELGVERKSAASDALRPSAAAPGIAAPHDHPLRRRLRADPGHIARRRRAGGGPAPVGHQRDGDDPALAGDSAALARAPRTPGGRLASQSHARQSAWPDAAPGAGQHLSQAQRACRPCAAGDGQLQPRSPARSSASWTRSRRVLGFPLTTSMGTSTCTCCPAFADRC